MSPRHLVSIQDLLVQELESLVEQATNFKAQYKSNENAQENHNKLLGKVIALLFSKRSTRTRISTEGAAAFFGAHAMFLGKDDIQLGVNESLYDTTRVISSMTSCIFARVNKHQEILDLCKDSSVPIINSLCDRYHPLQAITDILSIKESFNGNIKGLKLAWIGDANNVINDLSIAALKLGMNVSIAIPGSISFDSLIADKANQIAKELNVNFEIVNEPAKALKDANVIVTDTWISMGEEAEKQIKLKQFNDFQITMDLISRGNVSSDWRFMHCLPRHQEEVDDEIFYSDNSIVFEEAENRLYAAMAVIDEFVVGNKTVSK